MGDHIPEASLLSPLFRIGITAWPEVLLCVPKTVCDYSVVTPVKHALKAGDLETVTAIYRLTVSETARIAEYPKARIALTGTDGSFTVRVSTFDLSVTSMWEALKVGDVIYVQGSLQQWNSSLLLTAPVLIEPTRIGTVVPVYEKKRGVISDNDLFAATRYALSHFINETLVGLTQHFGGQTEQEILAKAHLKAPSLEVVLRAAHAPRTGEECLRGIAGMRRLAALSIVKSARSLKEPADVPESVVVISNAVTEELIGRLPYGDPIDSADRQSGTSHSPAFRCVTLTPVDIQRVSSD